MARICEITGKRTQVGNSVSHANNKTKRKFYPNLKVKSFYLAEENRFVTMKVCTKVIRTIAKNGLAAVIKKAKAKGTFTAKI